MTIPDNTSPSNLPSSTKSFPLLSREEIKQFVDQGMTDSDIAHHFGISSNQVHMRRKQMNLIVGQMTSSQLAEAVRLAETIKSLPLEAIQEIRGIVDHYQSRAPY
jgi:Zn-dependent peptidase ImmA (M78 family)